MHTVRDLFNTIYQKIRDMANLPGATPRIADLNMYYFGERVRDILDNGDGTYTISTDRKTYHSMRGSGPIR
jgi:hypothetical protein